MFNVTVKIGYMWYNKLNSNMRGEHKMRNAYIINTNLTHNPNCEQQMLQQEKCAAYYSPWKHYISLIRPNDLVFLYSNGKGIIARGIATGIVETADYENNIEEYKLYNPANILRTLHGIKFICTIRYSYGSCCYYTNFTTN